MEEPAPDIHNLSSSSSHRLPTISGTQALEHALRKAKGIPVGLPSLDAALVADGSPKGHQGFQRGHVTEIYGPPGVGKTTIALQLAVNTIHADNDDSVTWINTGSPLLPRRLKELMTAYQFPQEEQGFPPHPPPWPCQPRSQKKMIEDKFECIEARVLPHLLTLFLHPTQLFPPPKTALILVDDMSNLILGSFPRTSNAKKPAAAAQQDTLAQKNAGRRFQIVETLAAAMTKLAALKNVAIVVLNNASISLKAGQKATLKPALASQAWDAGIHTRIVLYRDFPPVHVANNDGFTLKEQIRFAQVERLARKDVHVEGVPFIISTGGIREIRLGEEEISADLTFNGQPLPLPQASAESTGEDAVRPNKRKAIEIADSEDEDEADDAISPRQHQEDQEPDLLPVAVMGESQDQDEMLLEQHERDIARRVHCRGAEDAVPISSDEDVY